MESLDQFRRLKVREKVTNVFVMSLHLSGLKVLHNITSVLMKFFSISLGFGRCFRSLVSKLLEFKEFNKTVIPFALLGYGTGYSQLGRRYATSLIIYHLISNARSWNIVKSFLVKISLLLWLHIKIAPFDVFREMI